ncbi:LCP family protein [Streptomyces sp. 549]|uniref:LCP family protein n=1 Tax=Streptomyces sp. 549 TaxID=3049076 RepID=UPI0024C2176F|nr:LCP family protein [Streptomyces sp. 549]MDK1475737.1 LCP family protein [Streptomyces sp. 549]
MRQHTIDGESGRRAPASEGRTGPPRQRGAADPRHGGAGDSGDEAGESGDGGGDGRRGGGGGPHPRKRRALRWTAVVLAVLILGTAGAGFLYYQHLNGNLTKDALHLGDNKLDRNKPNAVGQTPLNILLLGSDSRNSDENIRLGGAKADRDRPPLADVQMMVHVSADRSNMSVLSIPRDTRVTIPRCTDPDSKKTYEQRTDKINASLQNGGPGCTVATWEELTGIPVDHFMMIDFTGVVAMADAVGGVPVCVDANVHDPQSGLRLEEGESKVRGEQALQWLRTRHGFEDGSDLGRAKAQHMYMNAMVRELKAGTKLTNPRKLQALAEEATAALTVDDGLDTVTRLYDLGNDIRRVPAERITMATMPWVYSPGGSFVLPKEGDAEKVFSMIRHDVALDGKDAKKPAAEASPEPSDPAAAPEEIDVRVMNGTRTSVQAPVSGRASAVSSRLQNEGFSRAFTDRTPRSQWDTVVLYPRADLRGDAQAVADALGLPERAVKHAGDESGVTLVVGADWREGTAYPGSGGGQSGQSGQAGQSGQEKGAAAPEDDGKAPDSLDALTGDDDSVCMKVNPAHTW